MESQTEQFEEYLKLEEIEPYIEYDERYCREIDENVDCQLIMGQMGIGKTYQLIQMMERLHNSPNLFTVCKFSTRISFTNKINNDLKPFGFKTYSDENIKKNELKQIDYNKIIIQFESLYKLANCVFDYLIIDEAFSFFFQIYAPTNRNKMSINQKKLQMMFKKAKHIILLDAYMLKPVFDFYNELCGGRLKLIKNNFVLPRGRIKSKIFNGFESTYEYCRQVVSALLDYETVACPLGSKLFGEKILKTIQQCIDSPKTLKEDKEQLEKIKAVFYTEENRFPNDKCANEEFIKNDLVMYTPTVTVGVDFSVEDYITQLFAYTSNSTIDVFTFCQMIGRIRYVKIPRKRSATTHYIAVRPDPKIKYDPDDFDIKQIQFSYNYRKLYSQEIFQPAVELECDSGGYFNEHYKNDIYTRYYFQKLMLENYSRHFYMDICLHILKNKGYEYQCEFSVGPEIPIDKEITNQTTSELLREDKIEHYENADILDPHKVVKYKKDLERSVYKYIPHEQILYKKYSLKKTKYVNSTELKLESKDMVLLDEHRTKVNNLIYSKHNNVSLSDIQKNEIEENQYNHKKCSSATYKTLHEMFLDLLGCDSVFDKQFRITSNEIMEKEEEIKNFFTNYAVVTHTNYNINEKSKTIVKTLVSEINRYLFNWGFCGLKGKLQRSGKNRNYEYKLIFQPVKIGTNPKKSIINEDDLELLLEYVDSYISYHQESDCESSESDNSYF